MRFPLWHPSVQVIHRPRHCQDIITYYYHILSYLIIIPFCLQRRTIIYHVPSIHNTLHHDHDHYPLSSTSIYHQPLHIMSSCCFNHSFCSWFPYCSRDWPLDMYDEPSIHYSPSVYDPFIIMMIILTYHGPLNHYQCYSAVTTIISILIMMMYIYIYLSSQYSHIF